MDIKFIEQRIEQQKEYIRQLDLKVHSYKTKRYYELRESAAGQLRYFWSKRNELINRVK